MFPTKDFVTYFRYEKYNQDNNLNFNQVNEKSFLFLEYYKLETVSNKVEIISSLINNCFNKGIYNSRLDFCYLTLENIIKYEDKLSIIIQGIIDSGCICKDLLCLINRIKPIDFLCEGYFSNCNLLDILSVNINKDIYPFDTNNVIQTMSWIVLQSNYKESYVNHKYIVAEKNLLQPDSYYSKELLTFFELLCKVTEDSNNIDFYKNVVHMYNHFNENTYDTLEEYESIAKMFCGSKDVLYHYKDRNNKYFTSYITKLSVLNNIESLVPKYIMTSIHNPEIFINEKLKGIYINTSYERFNDEDYKIICSSMVKVYPCLNDYGKSKIYNKMISETREQFINKVKVFPKELCEKIFSYLQ